MSQMPSQEEDIWVERLTRYYTMIDVALDPLRENLSRHAFVKFYGEESDEWTKEQKTNPRIVFPPGDRQAQEVFYQTIDSICATFTSAKMDDWKALLRICFAALAGAFALTLGGNQFPPGSLLRAEIMRRTTANMQVVNTKAIQARHEREGRPQAQDTSHWIDRPTLRPSSPPPPKAPGSGLAIDDFVAYFHPETDRVLEFVVLGFRRGKQGGIRYTVAYVGNDDVEVELSEDEMRDILNRQVPAESEEPEL